MEKQPQTLEVVVEVQLALLVTVFQEEMLPLTALEETVAQAIKEVEVRAVQAVTEVTTLVTLKMVVRV